MGFHFPCRHFSSKLVLLQKMWRERGCAKAHEYSVSTDHFQMIRVGEREKSSSWFWWERAWELLLNYWHFVHCDLNFEVLQWSWVILGRRGFLRVYKAIFSLFCYGLASLTLNLYPCGVGPSRQHGQAHVLGQWVMDVAVLLTFCSQLQ